MPKPAEIEFAHGHDYLRLERNKIAFRLAGNNSKCSIVNRALDRYLLSKYLFDDVRPAKRDDFDGQHRATELGQLSIITLIDGPDFKCEQLPHEQMVEAYSFKVTQTNSTGNWTAVLQSSTSWGFIRGLETVSQLVYPLGLSDANLYALKPVIINDYPRFAYRGYMLDTARHYVPLDTIKTLLDAMSYNKLNVFHWHLVDDQSFPYVSSSYPQLSQETAYRPKFVYTPTQVREVIDFAANRGIRVIPELDSPGHSYPFRFIKPNPLTQCYDTKTNQPREGDFGPVDPTQVANYLPINRLIRELAKLFPDSHFHAGADEVDFDCWRSNPNINRWLEARGLAGNYQELSNYYVRRISDLLIHQNKTMMVWQEAYDLGANLPTNGTIIHVWKDINSPILFMDELARVVKSGYKAILSSCWYLNYIDYGQDWIKYYHCEPAGAPIEFEFKQNVLGGEVCMWTEFADETNLVSRTWPRASAAAERLWSREDVRDKDEFLFRLEQIRCRMRFRGLQVEPVNGPGYC